MRSNTTPSGDSPLPSGYIYLLIKLSGKDEEFNLIHYSLGRRIPIHIDDTKDIQRVQDNIKKSINELMIIIYKLV